MSVGDEEDGGARSAGEGAECGGDVVVSLTPEEREDEIAAGGHDLGRGAGADGRPVLVEGDVADVVEAV